MSAEEKKFTWLTEIQSKALRDPAEVIGGDYSKNGIIPESLSYKVNGDFISLLNKLKTTLFITREYENLVIALSGSGGKLRQSFLHLPHPSGIAVNGKTKNLYIAATRNPNQIIELTASKDFVKRLGYNEKFEDENYMLPSRNKYFPGAYYFHDLAFINGELYANSVGMNGIVKIDFNSSKTDEVIWSPLSDQFRDANYIQLNSIAAGKTLNDSFFSASAEKPGKFKPGDLKFSVDRTGVIFSGRTKKVIARNLTRPHSAKLYRNKLWVNNSGYGECGYIDNGNFIPVIKLPGWTRGLCFVGDIAFIGVSKVIPKYKVYAPGVDSSTQKCGVFAVNVKSKKILGSIEWKYGNQIFGIEQLESKLTKGFLHTQAISSSEKEKEYFFRHIFK